MNFPKPGKGQVIEFSPLPLPKRIKDRRGRDEGDGATDEHRSSVDTGENVRSTR
jgi:hypothetical protein